MTRPDAQRVKAVVCVGTGTIGSSWAAYFLARGLDVVATDPAPDAEGKLNRNIDDAWSKLERLGLSDGADRSRLTFTPDLSRAVSGAEFIQESAPDDERLKADLMAEIDAAAPADTVIASSSSEFLPSRISAKCEHAGRVIVGHPFVPVHLIPLVEVVGAACTDADVMNWAMDFYRAIGKRPLRLKKEIEAYVANRLQRAIFKEALSLVEQGVCGFDDIDDAVTWGPGLRWAIQGPSLTRHLGGGKGGVRQFIENFGWSGGASKIEAETFIEAIEKRWGHVTTTELESWRDDNLLAMLEHLVPPP